MPDSVLGSQDTLMNKNDKSLKQLNISSILMTENHLLQFINTSFHPKNMIISIISGTFSHTF